MKHARSWDRSPINAAIVAAIRERYPDGVLLHGAVLGLANELYRERLRPLGTRPGDGGNT